MDGDFGVGRRMVYAVISAAIGSGVFSLYFLSSVDSAYEHMRIEAGLFIGALAISVVFQFFQVASRFLAVILFGLGGGFGGIAFSRLFGTPIVRAIWIGAFLGLLVSIGGLWTEHWKKRTKEA